MPRILAVGHRAATSPAFRLDDLPGTGGRIDVLARVAAASFVLSHGLRRDVTLTLVMLGAPDPPRAVKLTGARLRHLNPDERTTGALLQKALAVPPTAHVWQPTTPGIEVARRDFASALDDLAAGAPALYLLEEGGRDVREAPLDREGLFVIGDPLGFTPEERGLLERRGAVPLSVGPASLHADHALAILLNELDRRGASARGVEVEKSNQ